MHVYLDVGMVLRWVSSLGSFNQSQVTSVMLTKYSLMKPH